MAAGNSLIIFNALANEPPSSNYATLDTRNGQPCLDFDASTDESAIFSGLLPRHYAGGGLTVRLYWAATSATSARRPRRDETPSIDRIAKKFGHKTVRAGAAIQRKRGGSR